MEFPRPTDADREFFALLIPDDPGVVVKPMFGNLGAFVNGTMFASLLGSDVGVRLSAEDLAELAGVPGSGDFGPGEKGIRGYLALPPEWRSHPELAAAWVERARAYVATLPSKNDRAIRQGGDVSSRRSDQ